MLRRTFIASGLTALVAGCAERIWATDEAVRAARFVSDEPPSITLFTVIGIPRGEGGHSALMINGSQRVIYDPAGSWQHPRIPERNDLLFGITDNFKAFYIDYHARENYWVAEDTAFVSREVADHAIQQAQVEGASSKVFCANHTANVLRRVPGFEGAPRSFAPLTLRNWFRTLPGVVSKQHRDGDPANNHDVLLRQRGQITAAGNRPVPQR